MGRAAAEELLRLVPVLTVRNREEAGRKEATKEEEKADRLGHVHCETSSPDYSMAWLRERGEAEIWRTVSLPLSLFCAAARWK